MSNLFTPLIIILLKIIISSGWYLPNPSTGCHTKSNFKRNTTSLNRKFSFFILRTLPSMFYKNPVCSTILPKAGFMPFLNALGRSLNVISYVQDLNSGHRFHFFYYRYTTNTLNMNVKIVLVQHKLQQQILTVKQNTFDGFPISLLLQDLGMYLNSGICKVILKSSLQLIRIPAYFQNLKNQLYGHLPPITKTIQARRTRHAEHCWRSKDELISDVLLWTPAYGQAKAYIQQLCEDTGCSPEDLPEAMNDREKWQERVRDIRASGTTS